MKNIIFIILSIGLVAFVIIMSVLDAKHQDELICQGAFNRCSKVEDITFEAEKVNIYMFWGNGCPHCKDEFTYLESLMDEYGELFKVYAFEVWYNKNNAKLMNKFAEGMGDPVSSVPYTVIGEKTFSGYANTMEKEILEAIEKYASSDYDVYQSIK